MLCRTTHIWSDAGQGAVSTDGYPAHPPPALTT